MTYNRILVILLLLGSCSIPALSSHLRGGEITIKAKPGSSTTYIITLHGWVNPGSTLFGGIGDILDFGDGSSMVVPEITSILRPDLGKDIGEVTFIVEHTYSGFGFFIVSYAEPNRNEGVLNMDGSVNQRFFIESGFLIDPITIGNSSPDLLVPPVDRGCISQSYFHAPEAVDVNSDSISYSLVTPLSAKDLVVPNYRSPAHQNFYLNFNNGNELGDGPPTFAIDPITGVLTWDAPGMTGEYSVAIKVTEWRKNQECEFIQIGFVVRDMQIIISDCNNTRPTIIIPNDTCVVSGSHLSIPIYGADAENQLVRMQAFSDIFFNSGATFSPTTFQPSSPEAIATFDWTPACENAREQYYHIAFKISDSLTSGSPLHTYAVWRVKVLPPAPTFEALELDLPNRSATIEWGIDLCRDVSNIQVWRRVAEIPYLPSVCETGMPSLGYSLIAERPASESSFIDTNNGKGLQDGVRYCYRLLGVVNNSCGVESIVSMDTCLAPILAEAPIITNVSVERTEVADGQIEIAWITPYDRELLQNSYPYQYELYRAEGFEGDLNISKIYEGPLTDTLWIDNLTNSKDVVYNYRVLLAWKPNAQQVFVPIDTSSVVSSVRLEGTEHDARVTLNWSASVPWSNALGSQGKHLIYRGIGFGEQNMVLIDSVDVFNNGFRYIDTGTFNNTPLDPDQVYAYKSETIGSYGNPKIKSPLRNFSQVIWLQPTTETSVCPPIVSIEREGCERGVIDQCDQENFTNQLSWVLDADQCRVDVVKYNVYASNEKNGAFVLITTTNSLDFYDSLLTSPARCYRIKAVNQNGVESEFSNEVCVDNCYYYELPNVFTPNGDGCNDSFSAFGKEKQNDPEGCSVSDPSRCARFVSSVIIKIYNRWGAEIYSYQSNPDGNIYINWDGSDKNGKELSTGTYYYSADVKFITIDRSKQLQTFKGWVQLLR